MHYMLNGGRDERSVLKSAESIELYKQLEIKKVLFIVYALVEEFWQFSWKKSHSLIRITDMELRSLTIYDTDEAAITEALAWADFIYFPGGSQKSLLRRMQEFGTSEHLATALSTGSVKLLGGGSAGAMVMGSWCIVGRRSVKDVMPGLGYFSGYVIDSHFSERNRLPRLQAVLEDLTDARGMGIDEDTAIVFNNKFKIENVCGPGTVTVIDKEIIIYDKNSAF